MKQMICGGFCLLGAIQCFVARYIVAAISVSGGFDSEMFLYVLKNETNALLVVAILAMVLAAVFFVWGYMSEKKVSKKN